MNIESGSIIRCPACGFVGQVLIAHRGYEWWMVPTALALSCTGLGMIAVGIALIWLGNQTSPTCPKCRCNERLESTGASPNEDAERIWEDAYEADGRWFRRNKLLLVSVVLAMLAAALVFYYVMTRGD